MESEIKCFVNVWLTAIASLVYCYYIPSRIPKGIPRLFSVIPVIYLFITLPWNLNSFHLGGPTIFFLVWLGNFKLILFSFDKPPLISPLPSNPFQFVSIACLPIKVSPKKQSNPSPNPVKDSTFTGSNTNPSESTRNQIDPSPETVKDSIFTNSVTNPSPDPAKASIYTKPDENPSEKIRSQSDPKRHVSRAISWPVKVVIMGLIIRAYEFRPYLNSYVTLVLYCTHMYLGIELVLALCALPARTLFGFELEPQFNEPYLTTSLQDFWGRRWNLMVSAILRPIAYEPARNLSAPLLGPRWAQAIGSVWAFIVSGLAHEVVYYYLTRVRPTWEVTSFFVLHGVCTAAEVAVKRRVGRDSWQPSGVVSGALTLSFLVVSGDWLFFRQVMRNGVHEKGIGEYAMMIDFCKKMLHNVVGKEKS